jgi:hypothetical protein
MKNTEITDPAFLEAVEAIDSGNISVLESLIRQHPRLVKERLKSAEEGYFKDPYLLWFVADNPIRLEKLPVNIVDITSLLVDAVKKEAADTAQQQLDYALGLVATGRIPKECGVQIRLMDLLIDAGATPGGGLGAIANGNIEAGGHLIKRGGELTLAAAVCLEWMDDVNRLLASAGKDEQLTALTAAAFYGKPKMISLLLGSGVDPNGYPKNSSGFHSHATPLHQAVSSGSLESVKLLVEAGANLSAKDKLYDGTPMDWAGYMQRDESTDEAARKKYALIAEYLKEKE